LIVSGLCHSAEASGRVQWSSEPGDRRHEASWIGIRSRCDLPKQTEWAGRKSSWPDGGRGGGQLRSGHLNCFFPRLDDRESEP